MVGMRDSLLQRTGSAESRESEKNSIMECLACPLGKVHRCMFVEGLDRFLRRGCDSCPQRMRQVSTADSSSCLSPDHVPSCRVIDVINQLSQMSLHLTWLVESQKNNRFITKCVIQHKKLKTTAYFASRLNSLEV